MLSGVKSRLKCFALRIIFIKRIQDSIRSRLKNANFGVIIECDENIFDELFFDVVVVVFGNILTV